MYCVSLHNKVSFFWDPRGWPGSSASSRKKTCCGRPVTTSRWRFQKFGTVHKTSFRYLSIFVHFFVDAAAKHHFLSHTHAQAPIIILSRHARPPTHVTPCRVGVQREDKTILDKHQRALAPPRPQHPREQRRARDNAHLPKGSESAQLYR